MEAVELKTEMLRAAVDGDVQTVRLLLKEGTPPDASNVIGQTALHFASMWGHADAVSALLDAGADNNVTNDDELTPLFYAVRKGQAEVVKILLDRGAKTPQLRNLLAYAEEAPNGDVIASMLSLHQPAASKVVQAVKKMDVGALKTLIGAGELKNKDAWEGDHRGRTPLHYAVLATIVAVELAVEQDADDPFAAGTNAGAAMLETLVGAAGTDVMGAVGSELDDQGLSALHYLVQAGVCCHPAALTLLLRAGASPNVQSAPSRTEYTSGQWGRQSADGKLEALRAAPDRTPLHVALDCDDPSLTIVKLLLEHGADPNVRDNEQRTALHLALDFGDDRGGIQLELAAALLRHGADPCLGSQEIGMANSCLHAAAIFNEPEVAKLLLQHNAAHSAPGKGGWTPLALAARGGAADIVMALLAAGADPDAPTPSGMSVRDLAALNKKPKVIEALNSGGASAVVVS